MASRISNKINRQALQKICQSLYSSSSESSCYPRSSCNDATAAASTIIPSGTTTNNINAHHSTNPETVPPVIIIPASTSANSPIAAVTTHEFSSNEVSKTDVSQRASLSTAYQVCPVRPKIVPTNHQLAKNQFNTASFKMTTTLDTDKPLPTNHLQPVKHPEYYVTENEDSKANVKTLKKGVVQGSSVNAETSGGYRKFQESMTYRNLTQPFKFSRLANPFPEPVKEMPSQKITDQEKSAQMFAEARNNALAQAHFAQRHKQLKLKPQVPSQSSFVRHYSSGGRAQSTGRTEKGKKSKKEKFRKIKTDKPCPPVNKSTSCRDQAYVYKKCTKKEAPYPCYSETCHEEKPFVCRSCPWFDDVNPAFKQKKSDYHTASRALSMSTLDEVSLEVNSGASSRVMSDVKSVADDKHGDVVAVELKKRNDRKKPDCKPNADTHKVPCAWVELDRKEHWARPSQKKKKKPMQSIEEPCIPKTFKRCPPNDNANVTINKKKRQSTAIPETTLPLPNKKAVAVTRSTAEYLPETRIPDDVAMPAVCRSIEDWLAGLHPDKAHTHCSVVTISAGGGGPCPKFPFKPEIFNLVINRKEKMRPGKCPKKIKRPLVVDCPDRNKSNQDCLAELFDDMLLLKGGKDDSKKKCPEVPEHAPPKGSTKVVDLEDPCNRKPKPQSEICPGDLLTRRRKDKPFKKSKGGEEDLEQAVAMLQAIERTRSAPSFFKPSTFKR